MGIPTSIKQALLIAVACSLLAGCTGRSIIPESTTGPADAPRSTSESEIEIFGNEFILEHGTSNRHGERSPLGYIIAPGGDDDLAWAHYRESELVHSRPVALSVDVDSVIAPGGDDDLPLIYWIGVADYTLNTWEWHGPFTDDASLELNSSTQRDRYVDADYNMNFIVLTDCQDIEPSEGNPQCLTAVEIVSSTVTTELVKSGSYFATRPHFTPMELTGLGEQSVTLEWTHVIDLGDVKLEANNYTVYRQVVGEDEMVKLAQLVAPASSFNDPDDAIPGKEDPVPGEAYHYYLQPANVPGGSPMSVIGPISIPLN